MFSEAITKSYMILAQKCQAGVKTLLEGLPHYGIPPINPDLAAPKHVRVGINNLFVEQSALVRVLIEKGVFTWDELGASMIVSYEEEVARLEQEILKKTGRHVTLDVPPGFGVG